MNFCRKLEQIASSSTKTLKNTPHLNNDFINLLKNSNSKKALMREYTNHKLYSENSGYYSDKNKNPIGRLETPLNFREMRGLSDYSYELNVKYPKSTWMTCPELLRPYFGYALGNYLEKSNKIIKDILNERRNKDANSPMLSKDTNKNIKIVEIGCGMGGAIDSVLEYLRKFSIKDYREIEYVGFELNPCMAEFTKDLLKKNHPSLFENGQVIVLNQSLFDLGNEVLEDENVIVLAINYFNSTPHDKLFLAKDFDRVLSNELKRIPQLGSINRLKDKKEIGKALHTHFKEFLVSFLQRNKGIIKETQVELTDTEILSENFNSNLNFLYENSSNEKVNLNNKNDNNKNNKNYLFKQTYEDLQDEKIIDFYTNYIIPQEIKAFILGEQFYNLERARQKKSEDWFIKSFKGFYEKYNNENKIWIPTLAPEFFAKVEALFPNKNLLIFDFDVLPSKIFNCDYKGKNAPVVYSIIENSLKTKTYDTIFESWETSGLPVNVYFPVDFGNLQLLNKIITGKDCTLNKFNYFMNEYSVNEWCESKSGFNPLIDTHHNTTFMLSLI